jgi:hypothetical protein
MNNLHKPFIQLMCCQLENAESMFVQCSCKPTETYIHQIGDIESLQATHLAMGYIYQVFARKK